MKLAIINSGPPVVVLAQSLEIDAALAQRILAAMGPPAEGETGAECVLRGIRVHVSRRLRAYESQQVAEVPL